jgi:hypothetical protein
VSITTESAVSVASVEKLSKNWAPPTDRKSASKSTTGKVWAVAWVTSIAGAAASQK